MKMLQHDSVFPVTFWLLLLLFLVSTCSIVDCSPSSGDDDVVRAQKIDDNNDALDYKEQISLLSKQVSALLNKRREDFELLEENIRKSLIKNSEMVQMKKELEELKHEVQHLRSGTTSTSAGNRINTLKNNNDPQLQSPSKQHQQSSSNQETNDHLTVKWLSDAVSELRTEFAEMQYSHNVSVMSEQRQAIQNELKLLRTDMLNMNKELEGVRTEQLKYEATLGQLMEEVTSVRDSERATAVICAKTKSQRVAAQLGISVSTITKIVAENRHGGVCSPRKPTLRERPITDLDEFALSKIKEIVYKMHRERKHITLGTILAEAKQADIFHGGKTSLAKILPVVGFHWKLESNRRFLMETPEIASLRFKFLKEYFRNANLENPLPVVFLDETWVFQKGAFKRTWTDNSAECSRSASEGGQRYIIVSAGSADGFVPGAHLIFASQRNTGDYHGEMNSDNFQKWFQEQLLPGLTKQSIIILDNARYHCAPIEQIPTMSWKKADIQNWLKNKNLPFKETDFKQDLMEIVQKHKPEKGYAIEKIAKEAGHSVLWLPPYHCQFNAIELIWGITKGHYNKNIGRNGFSKKEVLKIWQEALDSITPENWRNSVQHVHKIITEYWDREVKVDNGEIDPFIINVGDSDSSDDE